MTKLEKLIEFLQISENMARFIKSDVFDPCDFCIYNHVGNCTQYEHCTIEGIHNKKDFASACSDICEKGIKQLLESEEE